MSMLRYEGLAGMPAAAEVRAEVLETAPELLERQVNLMFTQRPDGRLVLGDTHDVELTEDPFEDEASDLLLLDEFRRLLGTELTVRRRWRGIYASSSQAPFLVAEPFPGVTVASVTSGIGMTTAFGLARSVLADALVAG
jgi:glycine/D-amino acid oxidase-like deaminating enzyme